MAIHFTERECDILTAMSKHYTTNQEIAEQLNISESTVQGHICRMLLKAGVKRRSVLLRTAIDKGWLAQTPTNGE